MKITLKAIIFALCVLVGIALAFFGHDIYRDRQHSMEILSTTPLLEEPYPLHYGHSENNVLNHLKKGDEVRVLRIKYGKDFMALKIEEKKSGAVGYVIYDDSIKLIEPRPAR